MGFQIGNTPDGPVGAGIDSLIMQDNRIISFATDLNISYAFNQTGLLTLGWYGPRDFKSTTYNLDFTMGTYVLRGQDVEGALSLPGWEADGSCNINRSGLYTFTTLDLHTLRVIGTIIGAKLDGGDITISQGSLNTHQTRWKAYAYLPGLHTS